MRKIEVERKKKEELQKVRRSYDDMMRDIKMAYEDKDQERIAYIHKNKSMKSLNKTNIQEKIDTIVKSKRVQHDDVMNERYKLQEEK